MANSSIALGSSINLRNINKSLSGLSNSVRSARSSASNITKSLLEGNREKRKSLALSASLFRRRREATLRKDREDILEARGVGGAVKRSGKVIMNSTKGFLGRIMDFLGVVLLGWAINNLPKIIALAEGLIKRMRKYFAVLQDFVGGVSQTLTGFTEMIGGIAVDIASFNFSNLDTSLDKMQTGFDRIFNSTQKAIRMMTLDASSMLKELGFDASKFNIPNLIEDTPSTTETETGGGSPGSSPTASRGQYTGKSANIPPEGKALLDAIAGSESGGYNSRYPSKTFSGYDDHPRIDETILSGPNKGLTSNAAGRYQFLSTTWDRWKPGNAFTPENQDIAAYNLAIAAYGYGEQGLLKALRENPLKVANKLSGTWTSLPGGIEPNNATNGFISRYKTSVERYYNTPSPIFDMNKKGQQPSEPSNQEPIKTNTLLDPVLNFFKKPPERSSITGPEGMAVASAKRQVVIIKTGGGNSPTPRPQPVMVGGSDSNMFAKTELNNTMEMMDTYAINAIG
jgi:muramidase (phage lysozyme)